MFYWPPIFPAASTEEEYAFQRKWYHRLQDRAYQLWRYTYPEIPLPKADKPVPPGGVSVPEAVWRKVEIGREVP